MGYQPDPHSLLSLNEAMQHSKLSCLQITLAVGTGQLRCGVLARDWEGIALPALPSPAYWDGGDCCDIREGIKYYHYRERNSGTTRTVRKVPLALFWYLWHTEAYAVLMQGSAPIKWLSPFDGPAFSRPGSELFPDPEFLVLLSDSTVIVSADLVFVRTDLDHWQPAIAQSPIIDIPTRIPHGNAQRHSSVREQILRATVAVLAAYSDQCRNNRRKVEATKVRELIDAKAGLFWPETGEPPLQPGEIERLIRECLKPVKTGE